MTTTAVFNRQRDQLRRDAILSATPAQLVTMLYDRLLLDLRRAESAQDSGNWPVASENLLHAQAIIAELTASLDTAAWDGAENLLGIYNYVSSALVSASIHRDVDRTREAIRLLEPLQQTWHQAAATIPAQGQTQPAVPAAGSLGIA
ncbi:flagellar export chaperone FliS [Pseudarthrobacter phenanthrenivorans]|uniref:Flagellar secretion chaperone FliS n=1 Tax=Pseudarthrobacter phenanthrenivorans TaxID=361575 RepID=A0A3B0FIY6_PSEPS|nr:flagellar export chaperone FliS [Pseudarthrobacter phenanthrenivorans]RKO21561.1 flagellar export chaperone FliS [Pseudarthrobacter phenanthrenivorans]